MMAARWTTKQEKLTILSLTGTTSPPPDSTEIECGDLKDEDELEMAPVVLR